MSILREQMQMNMELKGFSLKTQTAYLRSVKQYAQYYGKSSELLGPAEIKKYLHYMINDQQVSRSYINIIYSALKFLYVNTLHQTWDMQEIPRSKKPKRLPIILAPSELTRLFNTVSNPKHKALLMTMYGAGLRASEVVNLQISDIDSQMMQIRVRQAKGKKDRYTLLSTENLKILRMYWLLCKPKYWLFPGGSPNKPMNSRSIQNIMARAKADAKITKKISTHTLRHCFATHLLEAGANLYYIQHLLGHSSPRSTNVYLHLTRKHLSNIESPLDRLAGMNHG
jgi:integrase/recombinase XerD